VYIPPDNGLGGCISLGVLSVLYLFPLDKGARGFCTSIAQPYNGLGGYYCIIFPFVVIITSYDTYI